MIAMLKKPIAWLVVAILALLAIWWAYGAITGRYRTEANLGRNQADAALESGKDAVGTVGTVGENASESDKITQENRDAIKSAPGANASVDPVLRDTGLASLCRRRSYSQRPECVQFLTPR